MSLPMTPRTPTKNTGSPRPFVKPADLFKMRRRISNAASNSTNSSPLPNSNNNNLNNNINNNTNSNSNSCSTPNKNASNPFSPSKIRMTEQSPLKCLNNISDPSPIKKLPVLLRNPFNRTSSVKRRLALEYSPKKDGSKSPNKRSKMLEMDEDANLEPPKMKPTHKHKDKTNGLCDSNDWTLKTKLRVQLWSQCKNWNDNPTSIHRRRTGTMTEESPSKANDRTISIEAIKNAATVYQHPYLSWLPMFPRVALNFDKKKDSSFTLTKHSQMTKMMHKDWCESFNDLLNLLFAGHCPYFYMCSDNYNILFKHVPTSNPRRPNFQAYISPFYYGMGCELEKSGVQFKCLDLAPNLDDSDSSDLDENPCDDENDASQVLEDLGISNCEELSTLQVKPKGFIDSENSTRAKATSKKDIAIVEGPDNLRKLVQFLQTNRLYTISNVGRFACIPPTLLAPREFRLCTPQYPEVVLNKKMIDFHPTKKLKTQSLGAESSSQNSEPTAQTYFEVRGAIIPNFYMELHKLLTISDNLDHTCESTPLESSLAFKNLDTLKAE